MSAVAEPMPTTIETPAVLSRGFQDRLEEFGRRLNETYTRHTDWIEFFKEVMGPAGLMQQLFPTQLVQFEKTEEHAAMQQMIAKLRERSGDSSEVEPTRVITVRLPKAVHEFLKWEAHQHQTSMNQLCISKLLQLVDKDFVPNG